jgi:hypothetical protein
MLRFAAGSVPAYGRIFDSAANFLPGQSGASDCRRASITSGC